MQKNPEKPKKTSLNLDCSALNPGDPGSEACNEMELVFKKSKKILEPLLKAGPKGKSTLDYFLGSVFTALPGFNMLTKEMKKDLFDYVVHGKKKSISRAASAAHNYNWFGSSSTPGLSRASADTTETAEDLQPEKYNDIQAIAAMLYAETSWIPFSSKSNNERMKEIDGIIMVAINRSAAWGVPISQVVKYHPGGCPRYIYKSKEAQKSCWNQDERYGARFQEGIRRSKSQSGYYPQVEERIKACLNGQSRANIGRRTAFVHMRSMLSKGCAVEEYQPCPDNKPNKIYGNITCSDLGGSRYGQKCVPIWALHTSEYAISSNNKKIKGASLDVPITIGQATFCGPLNDFNISEEQLSSVSSAVAASVKNTVTTSRKAAPVKRRVPSGNNFVSKRVDGKLNVIVIGDSQANEAQGKRNFLTQLIQLQPDKVHKQGQMTAPGKTIGYIVDNFIDRAVAAKPDYIIIQGGGNDMGNIGRSSQSIISSFQKALNAAEKAGIKTVLLTIHALENRRRNGICPMGRGTPYGPTSKNNKWCKKLNQSQWVQQQKDAIRKGVEVNKWILSGGTATVIIDSAKILGEMEFNSGMGSAKDIHYGNAGHKAIAVALQTIVPNLSSN